MQLTLTKPLHLATNPHYPHYCSLVGPHVAPHGSVLTLDIPGQRGSLHALDQLRRELEDASVGPPRTVVVELRLRAPYGAIAPENGEEVDRLKDIGGFASDYPAIPFGVIVGGSLNDPANDIDLAVFADRYRAVVEAIGRDRAGFFLSIDPAGRRGLHESNWWPGDGMVDGLVFDLRDPRCLPVQEALPEWAVPALYYAQAKPGKVLVRVSGEGLNVNESMESGVDQDRIWVRAVEQMANRILAAKFGGLIVESMAGKVHENPLLVGRWVSLLHRLFER